jgi:hypothetical protein
MSKGPGQVQRAIMAAFESEPDNAFLLSELASTPTRASNASRKSIASP